MKRLILILLLLASSAWGEEYARMNPYILGAGVSAAAASPYCTGDNECTATTPGNCEFICEDFESDQHCVDNVAYDSVCRLEHRFTANIGTGQSADFTTATTNALCSDEGSNALTITSAQASQVAYLRMDPGGDKTVMWVQLYFNINELTLGDGAQQGIFLIQYQIGTADSVGVYIKRSGDNYNLGAKCYNCAATIDGATNIAIDGSTWYRLAVKMDAGAANEVRMYLNNVEEGTGRTDYGGASVRGIYIGWMNSTYSGYAATAATIQYDNIAVSASQPGSCNP